MARKSKLEIGKDKLETVMAKFPLKHAHTAMPIIGSSLGSCGEGWSGLLADCIVELFNAGWNGEISQIKEKYGTLRFYVGASTNAMETIISKYEAVSAKTCEICARKGRMCGKGWWNTYCKSCEVAQNKARGRIAKRS